MHTVRYSHENPYVKKVYEEFIGEPLGENSKKLFHVQYKPRPEYKR
jgi:iron only hydrogenase large subunit-like protein